MSASRKLFFLISIAMIGFLTVARAGRAGEPAPGPVVLGAGLVQQNAGAVFPSLSPSVTLTEGDSLSCWEGFNGALSISSTSIPPGERFSLQWCSPAFGLADGVYDACFNVDHFVVYYAPAAAGPYLTLSVLSRDVTYLGVSTDETNAGKTYYFFVRAAGCACDFLGNCNLANRDSNVVKLVIGPSTTKPTIDYFSASPRAISPGAASILSWSFSNASSGTISPEVGTVGPAGTANVRPSRTTTYTLTVGSATAIATVVVGASSEAAVGTMAGKAGVAGSADGGGGAARFSQPSAVTSVDQSGGSAPVTSSPRSSAATAAPVCCIYVADGMNHTIRRVDGAGNTTTIAGTAATPGFLDATGTAARFDFRPDTLGLIGGGVAVVGTNIFVADSNNHLIRKIDSQRRVTTFAGKQGQPGSDDGIGTAASFRYPTHMAADAAGNLYVADTDNHIVRKVAPNGTVTTFAGRAGVAGSADGPALGGALLNRPRGIALDSTGSVWITELGSGTLRRISTAGQVSTEVGTNGSNPFNFSTTGGGITVNPQTGDKYVGNAGNQTVDKVSPGLQVTPVAGTPGVSGTTDGVGTTAQFNNPSAVAVDPAGNLVIADTNNHTMRSAVPPVPCIEDATTACVLNGRFNAKVRYRGAFDNGAPDSSALVKDAPGFASANYETAFFYFNSENNIEMLLKLLDQGNVDSQGRPTIAVLFGTATPLRIELTLTDTTTGLVQTYGSEFGRMQGRTDFTAFVKGGRGGASESIVMPPSVAGALPLDRRMTSRGGLTLESLVAPAAVCVPDSKTACLLNGRFRAKVRYRGAFDNGAADTDALVKAVTGFASAGYETSFFYFNSENNIEMLVKMLDQGNTDAQGHPTIAVLYGTATPLRIELTITDMLTGTSRQYTSEFGKMEGKTDFTAFIK